MNNLEVVKKTPSEVQVTSPARGELGIAAMAAKAKAEVEARYVIALQRPRSIQNVRLTILESCKRERFAEGAMYRKPVGGGKTVDGLSIRFAEEALKAMTNISTEATIVWEDDDKRNIRVTVTDLESNTTYSDDIIIAKTVERKTLKEGQIKISERLNSYGDKVFLVAATEDDMANKVNSAKSKVIRNSGLRLIPQDILEEAQEQIWETIEKGGKDPKAETKKICDAFASIGVKPQDLERFLGHSLDAVNPKELRDLRATYTAIKDEETTWAAVIAQAAPKRPVDQGPAETAATTATTTPPADTKVTVNPYLVIAELCKRDGVTEAQVLAFAQKKKIANPLVEELPQVSDSKLTNIVNTWANILPEIKATVVAEK
jgi:hypothetical protein